MHRDLVRLGVHYYDWSPHNHLEAAVSPPGLPGEPSPYTNRVYTMRVIDFEHAQRVNERPEIIINDVEIAMADVTGLYPWRGE